MKQQIEICPSLNMTECNSCPAEYVNGFKIITQHAGEYYLGNNKQYHWIIFLLDGELEFSYNNYLKQHFKAGEFFFTPSGSEICSRSLTDSRFLVLVFNDEINSVCGNCALHKYSKLTHDIQYDFHPLTMTEQIKQFTKLIISYLQRKIYCRYLNDLKQKEFFAILPYYYTPKELSEFFFPIISNSLNFRTQLLKAAHEQHSISEIAQNLGMSTRTFSRKFAQEFGEPARFWLLKQKAYSIKLKLLVPGTNISDIMLEYKFTDMSHFTKFCKEHYKCTPSELIKQIKENKIEK